MQAHVERLTLLSGAQIHGDLVVYGPNAPVLSPEARVLGRVDFHRTEEQRTLWSPSPWGWLGWWLFRFLSLLALGGAAGAYLQRAQIVGAEGIARHLRAGLLSLRIDDPPGEMARGVW